MKTKFAFCASKIFTLPFAMLSLANHTLQIRKKVNKEEIPVYQIYVARANVLVLQLDFLNTSFMTSQVSNFPDFAGHILTFHSAV